LASPSEQYFINHYPYSGEFLSV